MLTNINNQIKEAMKSQQKDRLEALRFLKSTLLHNQTSANPAPELDVIVTHFKKLKEAVEQYPEGNNQREKIQKEMSVVSEFLPKALTEEEVRKIISEIIAKNASANMGMVMKDLTPQIKGRFDGKQASQIVQELLKR